MNSNGSLDTSFNGTGSTTLNVTNYTLPNAVALQPDGKILVGGTASTDPPGVGEGAGVGNGEFVVARFNSNGTLDRSFGSRGVWSYNPGSGPAMVENLALLPDGSIIGSGEGTAADGYEAFAAFKLRPTGALDTTFGTGGLTTVHVGTSPNGNHGLAVTTSGEIVLAGHATPPGEPESGCLVALTPAGRLDTNFNGTGYLMQNFSSSGRETEFDAVAAQGNTIVVAGVVWDGTDPGNHGLVARYTLSGALDASFNPSGTPGYFLAAPGTSFTAIGLESDGSIALGGWGYYADANGTHVRGLVAHLSADGVPDASFGSDGNGFAYFYGVASSSFVTTSLGPDGSLLLSGWTGTPVTNVFARFTAP
jgi:uncharacterized delta-60 repeat protein